MPSRAEVLTDRPESGQEPLGVACGFEALEDSLGFACGLVGVFGAIVQIAALAMLHTRQAVSFGCTIALRFVTLSARESRESQT